MTVLSFQPLRNFVSLSGPLYFLKSRRSDSLEKTLKRTTEDEVVGWHHQLNGHALVGTPGVGDGQGSLPCCSPWGRKESDTTE